MKTPTKTMISAITLVVCDYDKAIDFYVNCLGFTLCEDTKLSPEKRWIRVAPSGGGTNLLLARAATPEQENAIGNQAGGRVFLFLETENFDQSYREMRDKGVQFLEEPRHEPYGSVAVFCDPFGNKWDLIQSKER